MKKKETLEEFVDYLKEKPRTLGYDAILAYDRFRANRLLLQEYIDRFDSGRYFEPLTFSTTITPGAQWEKVIDHLLDKPRLSFENSSIAHSRADLTMRISGGKQLTLSRGAGDKVKKLIRVKEADALDGPALHMRIALDASPGTVSKAGTVSIDLKKADYFYLSFADTDEENLIGGARYKKIFDGWPDEKKIFVLNEMPLKESDFLQPEKFSVRTHPAPLGRLRSSDQYGEGEVLLFVTMKGSDNSDAGIPGDDESMHYLLPDAAEPYTMNLLLGNKFLIKRLVTRGIEKLEHQKVPFAARYIGDGKEAFVTGIQATAGQLNIPVTGATPNLSEVSFTQGLALNFVGGGGDGYTRFDVRAVDGKLKFEWFGKTEVPVVLTPKIGEFPRRGNAVYRWEYEADYQFVVETSGEDMGELRLERVGTPRLRQKMAPDQWLAMGQGHPLIMEEFVDFGEAQVARYLNETIETIVTVAADIDAFRLNGLLFRSGKEAAQPSAVRFPGDLTLPGYLSPARTQFEVVPIEPVVMAGGKQQFSTTSGSGASMTWTVENLPGEAGEDPGSINAATGEYTAPASSAVVRGNKKVIVTATSGTNYSKALVSITPRSIAVSPMVMQAAAGGKFKLSAATLNAERVTFSLSAGAKGTLQEDPAPDPSVQQSMLYVAPVGDRRHGVVPRKSETWRGHRATAAWRSEDDLAQLLAVETVDVSSASGSGQEQIPILLPLQNETNWFTHHVEGNGVRLKFWGTGKSGDYEVPAEDTTWYLVLGNGTLTDGLYTPTATDGKPLSRYAVVAAIEDDNRYWLWTYTILPIPLITPELLVEKLTEAEQDAAPTQRNGQ